MPYTSGLISTLLTTTCSPKISGSDLTGSPNPSSLDSKFLEAPASNWRFFVFGHFQGIIKVDDDVKKNSR